MFKNNLILLKLLFSELNITAVFTGASLTEKGKITTAVNVKTYKFYRNLVLQIWISQILAKIKCLLNQLALQSSFSEHSSLGQQAPYYRCLKLALSSIEGCSPLS